MFWNCIESLPSICFNLWTALFNIYTWDIFNLELYILELKRGFPRNYRKTWNFNRWYLDTSYFTVATNCKKKSINGLIFMNTDSQSGISRIQKLGNIDITANFVFPYISSFLLYLHHMMLVNVKLRVGGYTRIISHGCRLHCSSLLFNGTESLWKSVIHQETFGVCFNSIFFVLDKLIWNHVLLRKRGDEYLDRNKKNCFYYRTRFIF